MYNVLCIPNNKNLKIQINRKNQIITSRKYYSDYISYEK